MAVAGLLADGFPIQKLTPGRPGIQWNKIGAASDRAYEPDFQPGDRGIAQGGRGRNIFLLRGYVWLLNDHAGHVDPDGVRAGGHFAGRFFDSRAPPDFLAHVLRGEVFQSIVLCSGA